MDELYRLRWELGNRLALRSRAVYRTRSLHLAEALAQIFCLLLASFSSSVDDRTEEDIADVDVRFLRAFISTSPTLRLLFTVFLQSKQPIMKKQMKNARMRDRTRIRVVRLSSCVISVVHPTGILSCKSMLSVVMGLVETSSAVATLVGCSHEFWQGCDE